VAYKNHIAEWQDFAVSEKHVAAIRAMLQADFKAAGGRGELPKVVATRNILKGEVGVDAAAFQAGNETPADDEAVKVAKAYAVAIAAGHVKMTDLDAWPMVQQMVKTMLKPSLPPMPVAPSLPPMPEMPAAHSVKPVKGKRAA
jgi:hypothetical protein